MPKKETLDDEPYTWKESKKVVRIYWHGSLATTLRKDEVSKFLMKISEADKRKAQLIMAKITGNFKRGNERIAKAKR